MNKKLIEKLYKESSLEEIKLNESEINILIEKIRDINQITSLNNQFELYSTKNMLKEPTNSKELKSEIYRNYNYAQNLKNSHRKSDIFTR